MATTAFHAGAVLGTTATEDEAWEIYDQWPKTDCNGSGSMWFIATAMEDGEPIPHEAKFGGPEVCDELAKKTAEWLEAHKYPVPDHYRLWQFTQESQEKWESRSLPK